MALAAIFVLSREKPTVLPSVDSMSVVLPIRNQQSTLLPRIHYLLDWLTDLSPKVELILIDDASTDESYEILDMLRLEYPQISVIHNRRQVGPAACVQMGVQRTTSEVVFVRESYDLLEAEDLRELWKLRADPTIIMARARTRSRRIDESLLQRLSDWGKRLEASWFGKAQQSSELQMYRREGLEQMFGRTPPQSGIEVSHLSHRRVSSPKSRGPRVHVS